VIEQLSFLAVLMVTSPPETANPVVSPAEFRASFNAALDGKHSVPPEIMQRAHRFRYVFVAGFLSEGMSEYFKQNAHELRAIGVPRTSIHYIYPASRDTIDGNAGAVRRKFHEFAGLGPEKLVVIAHSRGACDALYFALQNPRFVAKNVEALFLVQGPFGGTGIADYVTGEGPPIDNRMPLKQRLVASGLGRIEEHLLSRGKHAGLPSLTRRASKEFWDKAMEDHEDAIPAVSPKTFYIQTKTEPDHLRLFMQATAWYLDTNFGPNDGLVTLEDQAVEGVGTVLAVIDAGHTDLTHKFPSAVPRKRLRTALIDAIIMAVGQD
jgi:hypothetical protein